MNEIPGTPGRQQGGINAISQVHLLDAESETPGSGLMPILLEAEIGDVVDGPALPKHHLYGGKGRGRKNLDGE